MFLGRLLTILVCSTLSLLTPAAAQGNFPNNEDLRHFRWINDPLPSPDGHQVLYRIADATADGGRTHLWVTDVETNKPRQITFNPAGIKLDGYRGETAGNWMPDGSAVLFLAKRGEHTQLFRLPLQGGEAQPFELKTDPLVKQLPDAIQTSKAAEKAEEKPAEKSEPQPIDVSGYEVSSDGKWIALWAEDPASAAEKKQKDDKADASWVDHEVHGRRLFFLNPQDGKLTATTVPADVETVAWSSDSSQLLALSEGPNQASDLGPAEKAYLVQVSSPEKFTELKELPATVGDPAWSHDGRTIYFHAKSEVDAPPGYSDLYEFTLQSKAIKNLSGDWKGTVERDAPIPIVTGGVFQPVAMGVRTSAMLVGAKGTAEPMQFQTPLAGYFGTNAKQTAWVYTGAGSTQPPKLYYTTDLKQPARAVDIPSLTPANARSVESKPVRWQSEQFTIEGLLYLPPQSEGKKVPLIVDVHGGPTGAWQDGYDPLVSFFVGQGWAVLRPNVRGSTNYGAAFAAANKNDLGGGDYRDLMAGVDYVIKNFPIDPDRLGLYGYSYGGEMAGFVEGKTNRFKAIVSGAPVIDQFSEYGTEDGSWYDRWFFGKPWEHVEDAWKQSPLAGAGHASTPFLLLQGEADKTDPLGQSQEMYRALRQMGVPVDLVTYPREGHGPLSRGIGGYPVSEPWHGFDARKRIVEFFQKAFENKPTGGPKAGN